tara:strand:- start:53069 stop:53566 length:498 start_codon:yes stop_codon:yes gene_type:complete
VEAQMQKPVSFTVLGLTLSGTLPFVLSAFTFFWPDTASTFIGAGTFEREQVQSASRSSLIVYAVAILSFMTGIRWGGELQAPRGAIRPSVMILAVLPALIAWVAGLMSVIGFEPAQLPLLVLSASFVLLLIWDLTAGYASWYVGLRCFATLMAAGSLAIAAFIAP